MSSLSTFASEDLICLGALSLFNHVAVRNEQPCLTIPHKYARSGSPLTFEQLFEKVPRSAVRIHDHNSQSMSASEDAAEASLESEGALPSSHPSYSLLQPCERIFERFCAHSLVLRDTPSIGQSMVVGDHGRPLRLIHAETDAAPNKDEETQSNDFMIASDANRYSIDNCLLNLIDMLMADSEVAFSDNLTAAFVFNYNRDSVFNPWYVHIFPEYLREHHLFDVLNEIMNDTSTYGIDCPTSQQYWNERQGLVASALARSSMKVTGLKVLASAIDEEFANNNGYHLQPEVPSVRSTRRDLQRIVSHVMDYMSPFCLYYWNGPEDLRWPGANAVYSTRLTTSLSEGTMTPQEVYLTMFWHLHDLGVSEEVFFSVQHCEELDQSVAPLLARGTKFASDVERIVRQAVPYGPHEFEYDPRDAVTIRCPTVGYEGMKELVQRIRASVQDATDKRVLVYPVFSDAVRVPHDVIHALGYRQRKFRSYLAGMKAYVEQRFSGTVKVRYANAEDEKSGFVVESVFADFVQEACNMLRAAVTWNVVRLPRVLCTVAEEASFVRDAESELLSAVDGSLLLIAPPTNATFHETLRFIGHGVSSALMCEFLDFKAANSVHDSAASECEDPALFETLSCCMHVCDRTRVADAVVVLSCGHKACRSCMIHTMREAANNVGSFRLSFECDECKQPVLIHNVAEVTGTHLLAKHAARAFSHPALFSCPGKDCCRLLVGPKPDDDFTLAREVHCIDCSLSSCANCRKPAHPGVGCDGSRRFRIYEGGATRSCPGCMFLINKNHGCDHMTCSRCRTEFCWRCGFVHRPHLPHGNLFEHMSNCVDRVGQSDEFPIIVSELDAVVIAHEEPESDVPFGRALSDNALWA